MMAPGTALKKYLLVGILCTLRCNAFVRTFQQSRPSLHASPGSFKNHVFQSQSCPPARIQLSTLKMGLDPVTTLRTEWISAALCTNQTPRSATVCLQLGAYDGRIIYFVPKTVTEIIVSSVESDGCVSISAKRQLKQQQERRQAAKITYADQRADDLRETADESVDVVISLQAAARMMENGLDWKKSIREAARVLKPGGRLLFVEQTELAGESYSDYVENLLSITEKAQGDEAEAEADDAAQEDGEEPQPVFDDVGWDDIDLVLVPHRAGVAIKAMNAGLSTEELSEREAQERKDRMAELSIEAYERGLKRGRRKKKDNNKENKEAAATPAAKTAPAKK